MLTFTQNIIRGLCFLLSACLIWTPMKPKKTIKFLYVWTLILVFASSVVLKGFHYHDSSYHGKAKVSASHEASVKQICSVCDFTMHKATEAQPLVFVPVVTMHWIAIHLFSPQTVYRVVTSINSHSPPTVG